MDCRSRRRLTAIDANDIPVSMEVIIAGGHLMFKDSENILRLGEERAGRCLVDGTSCTRQVADSVYARHPVNLLAVVGHMISSLLSGVLADIGAPLRFTKIL